MTLIGAILKYKFWIQHMILNPDVQFYLEEILGHCIFLTFCKKPYFCTDLKGL
jgi:hypothetical protein